MKGFYDTLQIADNACPPDCTACIDRCVQVRQTKGLRGSAIQKIDLKGQGVNTAHTCNHCSLPSCAEACPTGAIERSPTDGVARVNQAKCLGCGLCDLSCPYGGIEYGARTLSPAKCDLCDGAPECEKACPVGAISFLKTRPIVTNFRKDPIGSGSPLCIGCPAETALRFILRVMGEDTHLFGAPGCGCNVFNGMNTKSMCKIPSHMSNMTTVPSTMTGVKRYYKSQGKDVRCVGFVGDGCAADVGFQPLSGAAERNENIIFICYDNEGYMNTGVQRSSTTPYLGSTTTTPAMGESKGKKMTAKNLPLIMAAHEIPYVATGIISHPEDLLRKLQKAKAVKDGMAYIHLMSPCILGWGYPLAESLDVCRAMIDTNYFPLWEYERGKYSLTFQPTNVKPIWHYTKLVKKFSHLQGEDFEGLQRLVDSRFSRIEKLAKMDQTACLGEMK